MQQEEKSKKRTSIGKISGIVGIFCNFIFAGAKLLSEILPVLCQSRQTD